MPDNLKIPATFSNTDTLHDTVRGATITATTHGYTIKFRGRTETVNRLATPWANMQAAAVTIPPLAETARIPRRFMEVT